MEVRVREKLRGEVLKATTSDLEVQVRRGAVLWLVPEVDLLDAAVALAEDHLEAVQGWLSSGQLRKLERVEPAVVPVQIVVVQPWVLAQRLPE